MEILHTSKDLSGLPQETLCESLTGQWYHGHRVSILKTDTGYAAVSISIFERLIAFLYGLFNENYFERPLFNDIRAVVLDSNAVASEIKKTAAIAKKGIGSAASDEDKAPLAEEDEIDKRLANFERKQKEKEIKDFQSIFADLMALEIMYADLEHPQSYIEHNDLIAAAAFAEEYIQNNANGNSLELNKNTFSDHQHLSHFDTLIAAIRRLVISKKIHGYIIDSDKSVIKIALNDQSDLLQNESFVNQEVLINTIIKPAIKSLRKLDDAEKTPLEE